MIQLLTGLRLWQPLKSRDFRLLWFGEGVSILGDQFHLVALAWLALDLTGSGLALGLVLTAAAIPRAALMLVGGAITDRISPRRIMLISNIGRGVVSALLTGLILLDLIEIGHLALIAAIFGFMDAFFYPAFMSIVPMLIKENDLEAGNALLRSSARMAALVGPAPAGLIISSVGFATAFAFDSATFLIAAAALWLIKGGIRRSDDPKAAKIRSSRSDRMMTTSAAITEGIRYAWKDPVIRPIILIVAVIEFSFAGPFMVGIASMANETQTDGALAFGMLLSAWGGGALFGVVIAGSIPRPRYRGRIMIGISGILGIGLGFLGVSPNLIFTAIIIFIMSIGSGFINVMLMAWLQSRSQPGMIGRTTSLVMLASVGLAPLSYALAGLLVDLNRSVMFLGAGSLILVTTITCLANRTLRTIN